MTSVLGRGQRVASHSVKTKDWSYAAQRVVGGPDKPVKGVLTKCDMVGIDCLVEKGGICLFDTAGADWNDSKHALASCEKGGGKGAIFFNREKGAHVVENMYIAGGKIPAICVSKDTGLSLLKRLEEGAPSSILEVTIGDEDGDRMEYTFETMNGTSMAAPHVTATAALLLSHFPECSAHQIRYALALTAEGPKDGCNKEFGFGLVKVRAAYDWLMQQGGCVEWDVESISQGGCTTI